MGLEQRLKARAFALTFLTYMCFHLTRKVPSVLKGVLHPVSATGKSSYDELTNPGWAPFNEDLVPAKVSRSGYVVSGSPKGGLDGLYKCAVSFSEEHPCTVFANQEREASLALVPVTVANDGFVGHVNGSGLTGPWAVEPCPLEGLSRCWVVASASSARPPFAQRYAGQLPANAGASEASDTIHWLRLEPESGKYERDTGFKTKPDTTDGGVLLGILDSVFLGFYTVGLFFSGYLGDRVNLRNLLFVGMFGSAMCMMLWALAYSWHVHSMGFFVMVNVLFGLFQSTGWPSVVAVMGSWFGHGNRGLIMGVWNSHTSLGNILGSVLAAAAVGTGMHHEDWPLGYAIPGFVMLVSAFVVFAFLVPHPGDAGLVVTNPDEEALDQQQQLVGDMLSHEGGSGDDDSHYEAVANCSVGRSSSDDLISVSLDAVGSEGHAMLQQVGHDVLSEPLLEDHRLDEGLAQDPGGKLSKGCVPTFREALAIPGLIPFSLSLMFSKMCAYSVLYWGPYYLGSVGFSSEKAGYMCSFFDVGGVLGGIAAGFLSDRLQASASVAFAFQVVGIPVMAFYYSATSGLGPDVAANIWLMILVGFFVNAPYALITTAVSADLGTQVQGNARVLALVTGIIDGTGSFGAMIQGVVVGWISSSSWASVWHFLMVAQGLSALMISQLVFREVRAAPWKNRRGQ